MAEIGGRKDIDVNLPLLRHMVLNALRSFKVKFGAVYGQMIIATDSRKYWRKQVFPHYKANRKKMREDSGLDWNEIFDAINIIRSELAEYFPYPVIEVEGAEADDIIATLVEWSQTNDVSTGSIFGNDLPKPLLILSGDGDFEQLQRYPNVIQYSPIHKKWIKPLQSPDVVIMEHILQGDKGDGIPNFLSDGNSFVVGKRQKSLFKKDLEVWVKQKPAQFLSKSRKLKANFERNQQLIDLRFIPTDLKEEILANFLAQKDRPINRARILDFMNEHRMKNMLDVITDF